MCFGSQAGAQTGFLQGLLGPVTFSSNQQSIWQGKPWSRRVEKAVGSDTMPPWLPGPQLVISSSLWAVGGGVHLQSVPSPDYPLSFPQQTPCYYPHQSLLCHLYKLSPSQRQSQPPTPACSLWRAQRSEEPTALLVSPKCRRPVDPGRAVSSSCLDRSFRRPGAG